MEGRFVKDTNAELKGGSRLNYIFYENYTAAISAIDPFDALTDDDIKTAIRNASSLRPNRFVPEVAFETLSKQQINRLESPSLQCVQLSRRAIKSSGVFLYRSLGLLVWPAHSIAEFEPGFFLFG